MMLLRFFVYCICCNVLLIACKAQNEKESSPTMGEILIACDEQLREIIQQQEDIFERNYKYANVELVYANERNVFRLLQEDSVRTAITCRAFNKSEIQYFNTRQVHPRMFPFAKGAVALLCNSESRDTGILYEDFINLCKGIAFQNTSFKTVILEDAGSGIAQFLLDKIQSESFTKNVYALADKAEIIQYLKENREALAIVDWAEFSDSDNFQKKSMLKYCRVLGITRPKDSIQLGYILPDQYQLQDDKYPLIRTLYVLSVSGKSDLGLGFASFITGEIGQRILLKAGLLPLFQTERWIEIQDGSFRVVE